MAAAFIDGELGKAPLVIFSKTTCGYCSQVKQMLEGLALPVPAHIVELNQLDNMSELQDRLLEMTGGRSVPRVFVGGKFLGGCDDTMAAHASGEFEKLLKDAGAYGTAAATGGDTAADSTMVLLEQLPNNTAHTLAFQMKEQLSLATTPLVVKLSESSALCYLGSVADAAKAVQAGMLTLFQVSVAVKPYSDGGAIPLPRPVTPKVAAAPAPPAAAAGG